MYCDNKLDAGPKKSHWHGGGGLIFDNLPSDAINPLVNNHVNYYFVVDMIVDCKITVNTTIKCKRLFLKDMTVQFVFGIFG
jgi:hypothetical protein